MSAIDGQAGEVSAGCISGYCARYVPTKLEPRKGIGQVDECDRQAWERGGQLECQPSKTNEGADSGDEVLGR